MAKPLVLVWGDELLEFQLEKVDRNKLYGYVETEVCDEFGLRCDLCTIPSDGRSIVGPGGTALAYLTADGLWRKKGDLKPVDVQGVVVEPVKSSFDAPIALTQQVSVEDYLSHNIHLVYRLDYAADLSGLLAELKSGVIYQFPFSYRGGVEASAGFVILNSDGHLFLCVGTPTKSEFVGLQSSAAVVPDVETTTAEDDDLLDFSAL